VQTIQKQPPTSWLTAVIISNEKTILNVDNDEKD
jgi:hypothetical protein